jgi:hypothetical protein
MIQHEANVIENKAGFTDGVVEYGKPGKGV